MPLHSPLSTPRPFAWLTTFVIANATIGALLVCTIVPPDRLVSWQAGPFLLLPLICHFLCFGLLAALPAWLLGKLAGRIRWMLASAVLLQFLWLALIMADIQVFERYRFHLNAMVVNMLFGGALADQVAFPPAMWLTIARAAGALLVLEIALAWALWRIWQYHPRLLRPKRAWAVIGLVMLLSQGLVACADARGDHKALSQLRYIPWAAPVTLKRTLYRLGVKLPRPTPSRTWPTPPWPIRVRHCNAQTRPGSTC